MSKLPLWELPNIAPRSERTSDSDMESQAFFWCMTWHMGAEIQTCNHDWVASTLNYLATSSAQFIFIIFRMETKSY